MNQYQSVDEYFYTQIEDACKSYSLQPEVKFYILNLLSNPPPDLGKSVVLVFGSAEEAPPHQKSAIYRQVGDMCLTITGLFPQQAGKTVARSFYRDFGANSYEQAGRSLERLYGPNNNSKLYKSIANNFTNIEKLISRVCWGVDPQTNNVVSLLEVKKRRERP